MKDHGYGWPDKETKMRDLLANAARVEGWRVARSYYTYVQDMAKLSRLDFLMSTIKSITWGVLRLPHLAASEIFLTLNNTMMSYETINQVLVNIPEYQGGVFPIAVGLFHPYQKARFATVEILERLREHPAGRHFFNSMNRFQRLAFVRLKGEKDSWATGIGLGVGGFESQMLGAMGR